jgi:hypothetical protein
MFIYFHQNYYTKVDNNSFVNMAKIKYLVTTVNPR